MCLLDDGRGVLGVMGACSTDFFGVDYIRRVTPDDSLRMTIILVALCGVTYQPGTVPSSTFSYTLRRTPTINYLLLLIVQRYISLPCCWPTSRRQVVRNVCSVLVVTLYQSGINIILL